MEPTTMDGGEHRVVRMCYEAQRTHGVWTVFSMSYSCNTILACPITFDEHIRPIPKSICWSTLDLFSMKKDIFANIFDKIYIHFMSNRNLDHIGRFQYWTAAQDGTSGDGIISTNVDAKLRKFSVFRESVGRASHEPTFKFLNHDDYTSKSGKVLSQNRLDASTSLASNESGSTESRDYDVHKKCNYFLEAVASYVRIVCSTIQ